MKAPKPDVNAEVPKLGVYTATDENGVVQYKITIKCANPEIGDIRGEYWTKGSLMGEWSSPLGDYPDGGSHISAERSSSYSWIARVEGGTRINYAPFLIRIIGTASKSEGKEDKKEYKKCQHSWTGIYRSDDSIKMSGTQCYVVFDNSGNPTEQDANNLPEVIFKLSA
ncbi:MAG TPA: hypothetical protein VJZ77_12730 [Blastocatellia bacterium]|nr:hypothetical protein [Blastocatellia bacterium]